MDFEHTQFLLKLLRDLPLITPGSFTLAFGEKSNFYVDVKKAYGRPEFLSCISDLFISLMDKRTTCVAGQGYGGIPLATAVSLRTGHPLTLVRERAKNHGRLGMIEGYIPNSEDKISVFDDVFTKGLSLQKTVRELENSGAEVLGCYVVVQREKHLFPKPLNFLYTLDDLIVEP